MSPTFIPVVIVIVIAAILIFIGVVVVQQQTVAIIERLGKYNRSLGPGLGWRIPILERVAARVSLQVQEVDVETQTLTADNLFVELGTSLQIRVLADQVYDAHYQLENPYQQITSWTLNSLRTIVSQVSIADLYKDHASIEQSIQDEVATKLARYGYEIVACLIKSIQPSEEVQHSFNRVAAAERERAAAELEGEAFKIKLVKEAQAHAEAAKLAGQGIAQQRQEIAKGFSEAIATVKRGVDGSVDEFTIMGVLMASASFETIRDAARSPATVILMPYGAEGAMRQVADVATALRAGVADNAKRGA